MQLDSARGVACYTTTRHIAAFACVRVAPETVVVVPAKGKSPTESGLKALTEDSLKLAGKKSPASSVSLAGSGDLSRVGLRLPPARE